MGDLRMPWKRLSVLAAALVLAGAFAGDAIAQRDRDRGRDREERERDRDRDRERDRWVLLGERNVNFRAERDSINISQGDDWWRERGFRRLHLVADRSDIHLMELRLEYMNGFSEDLRVDREIREGQDQVIELRGERKYLRRIEFIYRSRPSFEGRAVLKVYGELSRFGGPGGAVIVPGPGPGGGGRDWVELGCKRVSLFGVDRDSIEVGRREGRFKAIRLHVRGADVNMLDLRVIYANGAPDDIPVRAIIRQGDRTRALDLRGRERGIDRVEMTYLTIPNFKGQATVCVEGLD
jgi:Ni/Co efflux regulator RcnB